MIIRLKVEKRNGGMKTAYYTHTTAGKPMCGAKGQAANFDAEMAKKVLSQLQTIDARFANAELIAA